jgi:hypothetical protein
VARVADAMYQPCAYAVVYVDNKNMAWLNDFVANFEDYMYIRNRIPELSNQRYQGYYRFL